MRKNYTFIYIILFILSNAVYAGNNHPTRKSKKLQTEEKVCPKPLDFLAEQGNNLHLLINPTATGNGFSLSYDLNCSSRVNVKMFNILGTLVYQKSDTRSSGRNYDQHDTGPLSQGIYMIEFEMLPDNGNAVRLYNRMNFVINNNRIIKSLSREFPT